MGSMALSALVQKGIHQGLGWITNRQARLDRVRCSRAFGDATVDMESLASNPDIRCEPVALCFQKDELNRGHAELGNTKPSVDYNFKASALVSFPLHTESDSLVLSNAESLADEVCFKSAFLESLQRY